jgi:hypothetical protein
MKKTSSAISRWLITVIAQALLITLTFVVFTQAPVFAFTQSNQSEIANNEKILSKYTSCKAANDAGYLNLKTSIGFKPPNAKRSFDGDKDGISCESRHSEDKQSSVPKVTTSR